MPGRARRQAAELSGIAGKWISDRDALSNDATCSTAKNSLRLPHAAICRPETRDALYRDAAIPLGSHVRAWRLATKNMGPRIRSRWSPRTNRAPARGSPGRISRLSRTAQWRPRPCATLGLRHLQRFIAFILQLAIPLTGGAPCRPSFTVAARREHGGLALLFHADRTHSVRLMDQAFETQPASATANLAY